MRRGKSSRSVVSTGLQVHSVGIAAGAAPVSRFGTEQLRCVQVHRLAMIRIHVIDGALLGFQQRNGIGNVGQKLLRFEIDDAAETGHQMRAGWPNPEEGKILKIYKDFRRRMSVEVAAAQNRHVVCRRPAPPGPPA